MRSSTSSFTSPGSSSSLLRPSKPRKVVGLSPLATHESKATSSSPPTRRTHVDPLTADSSQHFFEHGMGSQIMLASSGSQAKQLLLDRARRTLEQPEVEALQEKLKQVYTTICRTVYCYKVINPLFPVVLVVGYHSSVIPLIHF